MAEAECQRCGSPASSRPLYGVSLWGLCYPCWDYLAEFRPSNLPGRGPHAATDQTGLDAFGGEA
ncbi:hypothetical protein [Halopelagius fulvigenes]|uniref:Small CPxCG-related zinc finger protein n=1 Tax=Halopelagius fulvigenes TaxID=1198324 RepID=A0ABD5U4Q6_9EURY